MRSFDQRKKEIFERSKKIIKERKRKRKEVLTVCISLAVCISVLSVLLIQKFKVSNDNIENTATTNSATYLYTSLEITNHNTSQTTAQSYHDAEAVNRVYTIINSYFSNSESLSDKLNNEAEDSDQATANKYSSDKNKNDMDNFTSHSSSVNLHSIITFKSKSGSAITYSLYGNTLINRATDQKVILSDSQLSELQTILDHKTIKEESK